MMLVVIDGIDKHLQLDATAPICYTSPVDSPGKTIGILGITRKEKFALEQLISLDLSNVLVVLAIAASPISELRGAIPVAITVFHFPWYYAFLLAIIGNIIPVPLLLLSINTLSRLLRKKGIFERMFHRLLERTRRRSKIIERYGRIGLMLFVAIPLPVTGAWTGSLAAVLFGIKFKHAFLSIFIGILIAGSIVTCLSLLGWTGAIIAGLGLIALAVFGLWRA